MYKILYMKELGDQIKVLEGVERDECRDSD
jgi:hypothetical protein